MTEINTSNRIKTPGPPAAQSGKQSRAAETPAREAPASAVVELSSEQVMKQMQNLPEVDSQKVEAIKNAIANGEYRPDPELIAKKFSDIEKLLP